MAETKNISFVPRVYERVRSSVVLDRSFKEFGQTNVDSEKSVEQFFIDYEDLYFQIPVDGDINSHKYLIERSSELYKLDSNTLDIQPLLDEIDLLRSQSVEQQLEIVDLRNQLGINGTAD